MQTFLEQDRARPLIYVDDREKNIEELKQYDCDIKITRLEVGDYVCSAKTVVERKTSSDFEASVIDGRLFKQIENLKNNYENVILIVEGQINPERITKEAFLGTIASLMTDYKISVLFSENRAKTNELIYSIAKHEQMAKKRPQRIYAKRKALTIGQQIQGIIECFPFVGPKTAKNIADHFKTIYDFINCNEKELAQVKGVGKKKAKIIYNIIHAPYKE